MADLFGEEETATEDEARKLLANALLAKWIERQPFRPSDRDIKKHRRAAANVVKDRDPRLVMLAALGMGHLFPYSKGHPWDMFDLNRVFTKAVECAKEHPSLKKMANGGIADVLARRRDDQS